MIKFLFFDGRGLEISEGWRRELAQPTKQPANPLLVSDHPLEGGFMSLYGSVVRRPEDGLWQMWYTVTHPQGGLALAYAESADGIAWQRADQDVVLLEGQPTHLVMTGRPHGATVLYDEREMRTEWRYKMLAGAAPSDRISAFRSADGIHWFKAAENPVIGTHPDCPLSLQRGYDGRYVVYGRPAFGDRRVARRESFDLVHWSEPRIVVDQEPSDPPQTQFYGMGAIPYGAYELGTLWIYQTEASDLGFNKMHGHQQPELAYTRSGYAWHRAAPGTPWIPLGEEGSWEAGMIQPASAPVLLSDEIRFYYAASRVEHGVREYADAAPRWGIGYASMPPDRFVRLRAGEAGHLLTRPFWTAAPEFYANAAVAAEGEIRVAVEDLSGQPIPGFGLAESVPLQGDSLHHRLRWRGDPNPVALANRELRLRVQARHADLYALMAGAASELAAYWRFEIPSFLSLEQWRRHASL